MRKASVRALILVLASTMLLAFCAVGDRRRGLFNNNLDDRLALAEHRAAWNEQRLGNRVSRLQMEGLALRYRGFCSTAGAGREQVSLKQGLDQYLQPEASRILCDFPITRVRMLDWRAKYTWVVELEAISPNELRVIRTWRLGDKFN